MLYRFYKKIDKIGKIFVPKAVIEKFGREYYMEVYEDKIILIPVKLNKPSQER